MLNVFITKLALNNSSWTDRAAAQHRVKRLIIVWVAVIEVKKRSFPFYLNSFILSGVIANVAVTGCQIQ